MKNLIVIQLEDYRALIRGEMVTKGDCSLILSDLGWALMLDEITRAAIESVEKK